MTVRSIVAHPGQPAPASAATRTASADTRVAEAHERLNLLAAIDAECKTLALAFVLGSHPVLFDQALDAATDALFPAASTRPDEASAEPYCLICGAPVGIFLAHGGEYRHFRGILTATSKPRPYKADHKPVVGWRPAAGTLIPV
jgi:hypothetical protein